jgi:hypothetical protein
MPKFRKKPVVIDAVQWTGENPDALDVFCGNSIDWQKGQGELLIATSEGDMIAREGDWIIKGVKGEFYPCKPDIFEATYEPAE